MPKGIFLVLTKHTQRLVDTTPAWGHRWDPLESPKLPTVPPFQQTHCCDSSSHNSIGLVQHIIVHALARHASRALSMDNASACLVAAPPSGTCEAWDSLCPPQLPLVVADVADVDDFHAPLCKTLWQTSGCAASASRSRTYRLVSSPPVLIRRRLIQCPMITVPWPSHARSPDAALHPRARDVHVAFAGGVTGHILASRMGFENNRRRLRDACHSGRSTVGS